MSGAQPAGENPSGLSSPSGRSNLMLRVMSSLVLAPLAGLLAPDRLNALVFGVFAGVALLIAVVGVAGVLAFSVSARTTEIGIRMSLGADSARVQRTPSPARIAS